jgi:hypothetical protein
MELPSVTRAEAQFHREAFSCLFGGGKHVLPLRKKIARRFYDMITNRAATCPQIRGEIGLPFLDT